MDISTGPAEDTIRREFEQFLGEETAPIIRRMADRPAHGSAPDNPDVRAMVWQALVDLGATRLSLAQSVGGRGLGQRELVVLAELLGVSLYQGPLLDTVLAAEAVAGAMPSPERDRLLKEIVEGTSIALAVRETGHTDPARPGGLVLRADNRADAERVFVGFAAEADRLLLVGRTDDGRIHLGVFAREQPGVATRRQADVGRGELCAVRFDGAVAETWLHFGDDDPEQVWQGLLAAARVRQAAYLNGAARAALDLGVEHARKRRQFGKPIGHHQALAFRLARAATRNHAARLLVGAAAWEVDQAASPGDMKVQLSAAQALAQAADTARATVRDVMQVHGAHGMTEASEAQLFHRRVAVDAIALGTPLQLRSGVAPLLLAEAGRAAR